MFLNPSPVLRTPSPQEGEGKNSTFPPQMGRERVGCKQEEQKFRGLEGWLGSKVIFVRS